MRFLLLGTLGTILVFPLPAQEPAIRLTRVASGLSMPTDIQHAGDGANRLFLVQQGGRIHILKGGAVAPAPFLDISSRTRGGGERGLLGLAFPPEYARKRHFYINYTNLQGHTVIARYRTTSNPDVTDPASEQILLTIDQPYSNHNGGQLRFGPDGYLWIGMGDGGSGGDPQNNAQSKQSLLGKMLRVDVESDLTQVRIPPDNPFVGDSSYQPAIWALGLRNPWRFSFDRATGDLWIADVGQNRAEEIDFQPAANRGGENYGWSLMEGLECYRPACSAAGLVLPVLEYGRSEGCSVTGGFVYRGSRSPALRGTYLYGDYCSGRIWGLRREGERWVNRLLLDTELAISTFGEDEAGEVYVAGHGGGTVDVITGAGAPSVAAVSAVNAASGANGVVPGSLATVYGTGIREADGVTAATRFPLPASLDGVSVTVNDRPAPLLAVASRAGLEQINLQVPFEIAGADKAAIVVTRSGASSAPVEVPVLAAQPGVFTANGTDAIVVHHADNTLVTRERPVERDEFVYFYATGLGAVENSPGTGNPGPRNPLARTRSLALVTLGGVPCEVLYSGLAPDFAGLYQLNVRVPAGAPSGDVDLALTMENVAGRSAKVPVR